MGIPRKKSRNIEVDGRHFRWMLSSYRIQERWDDEMPAWHTGTATVQEEAEKPEHVVQVELRWLRGSSVTPEIMREVIRRTLNAGWDPESRKAPELKLEVNVEEIETKMSIVRKVMEL